PFTANRLRRLPDDTYRRWPQTRPVVQPVRQVCKLTAGKKKRATCRGEQVAVRGFVEWGPGRRVTRGKGQEYCIHGAERGGILQPPTFSRFPFPVTDWVPSLYRKERAICFVAAPAHRATPIPFLRRNNLVRPRPP